MDEESGRPQDGVHLTSTGNGKESPEEEERIKIPNKQEEGKVGEIPCVVNRESPCTEHDDDQLTTPTDDKDRQPRECTSPKCPAFRAPSSDRCEGPRSKDDPPADGGRRGCATGCGVETEGGEEIPHHQRAGRSMTSTTGSDGKMEKWSKQFRKKACIIKLDGCHYTIVANSVADNPECRPVKAARVLPRAGSLTVLKRTLSTGTPKMQPPIQIHFFGDDTNTTTSSSSTTTSTSGTRGLDLKDAVKHDGLRTVTELVSGSGSKFAVDSTQLVNSDDQEDLENLNSLPPTDTPEALRACSVRLKQLLKKVIKGETSKEELLINLDYAARVSENIYIVENSRRTAEADDDVLGVVEQDSVPHEVREWLTLTFTRTSSQTKRRRGEDRLKFRSVANAIRAGIMVDKIYRRMSSLTNHDAPPDVQALLKNVDDWSFDVFALNDSSEGRALKYIGHELLHRHDLINKFKINETTLENFLSKLEVGYRKFANPYHNLLHAADVTQTTNVILTQTGLALWMTDLEIFATLTSSLVHDYEHTGTTNTFHINTNSEMALVYNDRAVLENYHASASFRLLREEEFNILSGLKPEEYREFRSLVIELVLATDMSNHFQQIKSMKNLLPDNMEKSQVLALLVHCADISHPAKDWNLHHRWTELLLEEFFRQGDREAALGLPISPLCDRNNTLVAESQIGFIDFIVDPTFTVLNESIEMLVVCLQQQCASISSDKEDAASRVPAAAASVFDDASSCSSSSPHKTMHADLGTPSTPKSPHFPVKVEELKHSWSTCLVENKSRWKQKAAEDVPVVVLPTQESVIDQLQDDDQSREQIDVLLLDDEDDDDDDEEDEDSLSLHSFPDQLSSSLTEPEPEVAEIPSAILRPNSDEELQTVI